MPIHDWTRVGAGIFHDFHHSWIGELKKALNRGLLPREYYALAEQIGGGGMIPDVLTLQRPSPNPAAEPEADGSFRGGLSLATAPPKVRFQSHSEPAFYATKAKAVVIRHSSNHKIIAIIEIVSPGNKNSRNPLLAFIRKAQEALFAGVHLLIVDLFPPGPRDRQGIHPLIWGKTAADDFVFSADKPLTCAAYVGGFVPCSFVEPVAVSDVVPEMPLFLTPDDYIYAPLETTYQAAWESVPAFWQEVLTATTEA
jgi:hypothetical protein